MNLNTVLKDLPPFTGRKDILIYNQDVEDIIKGILKASDSYAAHYRKIWPYFEGGGYRSTARNVWTFLKSNSDYVIEADSRQTIKTPAAVLATAKKQYGGNDCKNLSLFSAGVLRAYRDATGEDFNLYFRFAGYNGGGLSHVFTVIEKNGVEIWIDPVLDTFNDRTHKPTKIKDFKINKMALIALSGIDPFTNDKSAFENSNPVPGQYIGADGKGKVKVTKAAETVKKSSPADSDLAKGANLAINVASGNWAAVGVQLVDTLSSLFGGRDNPQDYWQAWDRIDQQYGNQPGAGVQHWIMTDGDSVQNEALNIMSYFSWYIQNRDPQTAYNLLLGKNATTLRDTGRYVTFDDLIDKLNRGGYSNEAIQLKETYNSLSVKPDGGKSPILGGTNMFVTIALIGAAAFFLFKRK